MTDGEKKKKYNEQQERKAMDGLFAEILKETDKSRYEWQHTSPNEKTHYDSLVIQYNKATNSIIKRMFFEAKIRGVDYDTLLIEKYKLTQLKNLVKEKNDKIYYANFLPSKTVVFDLLKIENKLTFVEENHNIETANKALGKRKKLIAYPPISDGTIFPYVFKPEEYVDLEAPVGTTEAFPKEGTPQLPEAPEEDPDQTKLEIPEDVKKKIRLDDNGDIVYDTHEEFKHFPMHIQWRIVMEKFLIRGLLPNEDKNDLIQKYGSLEKVYKFAKERQRLRFLAMYGYDEEGTENKYEIKD